MRFTMLETIRQYAYSQLAESGELERVRQRQAEYFTNLVESAEGEFRTNRQLYWMKRLRLEEDNIRLALDWSLNGADVSYGLRIAAAMLNYWYYNGLSAEGRRWTGLAIARMDGAPPQVRAGLLGSAGNIAYAVHEIERAKEYQQAAIELYRELGVEKRLAYALMFQAVNFAGERNEYEQSRQMAYEALKILEKLNDLPGVVQALNILGELARSVEDFDLARRVYEQSLQHAHTTGEVLRVGMLLSNLSFINYRQGRHSEALQQMVKAFQVYSALENVYYYSSGYAFIAGPLAALGEPFIAAQLLAVSEKRLLDMGAWQQPADQIQVDLYTEEVRRKLGSERFLEAWQAGSALKIEEALRLALESAASLLEKTRTA
jgi:non-specific serine/threonine protein kinase